MASELSDYLANAILNWVDGDAFPTAPTDVFVALWDGDPGPTGATGTEVTEDIRVAGRLAVTWGAVASRQTANSADLDFGSSAATQQVTHAALFDASTGGNMLAYSPLDNIRNVILGDPVVFPAGDITFHFN